MDRNRNPRIARAEGCTFARREQSENRLSLYLEGELEQSRALHFEEQLNQRSSLHLGQEFCRRIEASKKDRQEYLFSRHSPFFVFPKT